MKRKRITNKTDLKAWLQRRYSGKARELAENGGITTQAAHYLLTSKIAVPRVETLENLGVKVVYEVTE